MLGRFPLFATPRAAAAGSRCPRSHRIRATSGATTSLVANDATSSSATSGTA